MQGQISFRSFTVVIALVGLTACGGIILKMYGMKKLRSVDTQEIKKYATKFGIPSNALFELDTAKYFAFLRSIDTTKSAAMKNHAQPLQAIYFTEDGEICSWHINCFAGGFPNLEWERDSLFSTFPPKQQVPLDSLLMLRNLYGMIKPIDSSERPNVIDTTIVVVFWNRWMGRQSERLIHIVRKNAQGQKAKIIYINNDNFFAVSSQQ